MNFISFVGNKVWYSILRGMGKEEGGWKRASALQRGAREGKEGSRSGEDWGRKLGGTHKFEEALTIGI